MFSNFVWLVRGMDRGEKKKKQRGWMEGKKESDEEKIKEKK